MPQITVDPNTGHLLLDGVPVDQSNAYGTSGQYLFSDHQGVGMQNPDDRYYSEYGGYLDEPGNWVSRWGPSESTMDKLGGMIQPQQFGIGGYSEIKDPSRLIWNDEFGILTSPDNIGAKDPGLRRRALAAVSLIVGAGLAANAGMFGAGAGGADAATGYGLGGSAGEAGAAGGMGQGGLLGGGMATDIAPGMLSESVAPTVTETMAGSPFGGNSMWQSAMNYATSNPLQAARGVAGLMGAVGSAGGGSQQQGGSSAPSGLNAPSFNPLGAAGQFQPNQSNYQQMQFDPVPFMGGSMYQNYQPQMGPAMGYSMQGQGFGGMGMTGGNMSPGGYQNSWGSGGQGMGYAGGFAPQLPSQQPMGYAGGGPNPFGMQKPYMPPQFNMGQQQPMQGGLLGGGMPQMGQPSQQGTPDGFGPANPNQGFGRLGSENQMAQNGMIPGMTNREFMGYARYLPGSKTPMDPNFSQNLLAKSGGDWKSMVPQRAQAGFQQFLSAIGNPQSFGDYQNWARNY